MKKEVIFNYELRDQFLVDRIINRFMKDKVNSENFDKWDIELSLRASNGVNGNPNLALLRLESFDDFDFFHDMMGIVEHINKKTGELEDFFIPRCARLEKDD